MGSLVDTIKDPAAVAGGEAPVGLQQQGFVTREALSTPVAAGTGVKVSTTGRDAYGTERVDSLVDHSTGIVADRTLNGNELGENLQSMTLGSTAVTAIGQTTVIGEGPPVIPNPNTALPSEYETRVQVIQKYPEMKTVEEMYYVKEVRNETRTVMVPKTKVIMEEHEKVDMVPVVKQVPKTRTETVHRVIEEQREVTDMVPVVEMVAVPRIVKIPRLITEELEELVEVPTVVEVPMTRIVQVPTGNYCEVEAGTFVNPTDFNLLGTGHGTVRKSGSSSSSSSSSSDDEVAVAQGTTASKVPGLGTATTNTTTASSAAGAVPIGTAPTTKRRKKKSLLQRIEQKIVG